MKEVKVVIGANFGDEGKGLMTDYFCSQFGDSPVLNVRYNGTCQAGHTVVKNGVRHVFSHFGSGSFNKNVVTYLSSDFYVNPILFNKEYDVLVSLGYNPVVKCSKNAPIVLLYDMIYNRVLETSRGNNRHGSCGMGLWEALLRGRKNKNLVVSDVKKGHRFLLNSIREIRDEYFRNKFKADGIELKEDLIVDRMSWFDDGLINLYISEMDTMLERMELVDEWSVFDSFDNIVFEGAQGLLLDWMNREYMPYLTASRTGLHNVVSLLKYIDKPNIEVCYVTRTYFTRHGAGLFKTEVENKDVLGCSIGTDKTNASNPWQGNFRYGYFDLELFKKSLGMDLFELYSYGYQKSICLTHLNETDGKIITKDRRINIEEFKGEMGLDWNIYTSDNEENVYKNEQI